MPAVVTDVLVDERVAFARVDRKLECTAVNAAADAVGLEVPPVLL